MPGLSSSARPALEAGTPGDAEIALLSARLNDEMSASSRLLDEVNFSVGEGDGPGDPADAEAPTDSKMDYRSHFKRLLCV